MQFIGQAKLKTRLAAMSARLPRFLMLVGANGSGKRTAAKWLIDHMSAAYEIVDDQKVDSIREIIESSLTLSQRKIYLFPDVQNMNMQAQNAFLKTLEEPAENAYYIMTVNSSWNVLSTIRSRAVMLEMDGYDRDELVYFTQEEDLLMMCSTPGIIQRYESFDWRELLSHCEKVVDNIGRINIGNTFNIIRHVKEENYDLVIPTMQYVYWKNVTQRNDSVIAQLKILQEASTLLEHNTSINTRNMLETMFLKLWEVS